MSLRAYVMGVGGAYLSYVIAKNRISTTELGITTKNFIFAGKELIIPSLAIVLTSSILLTLIPKPLIPAMIGHDPQQISGIYFRLFLYSFWSVPFQELLFRSYLYLFARTAYNSPKAIAFIMWLIFVLAHVSFFSPLMMLVAMWMGYVYVKNYLKYFNIFPIMISHAAVGSLLIILRNFYLPYN